jgi:hypothetical protein
MTLYITAVHYEHFGSTKHITELKMRRMTQGSDSPIDKEGVLNLMNAGAQFYSLFNGKIGAKVIPEIVKGKNFLKTIPDGIAEDNLNHLPIF